MKRILIVISLLICIACSEASAQTWNEWFRQKKTQRRYLKKQIVLLQIYLGYLKKGYRIVDKGLTTIGKIKEGDFNLHQDYFTSLKEVKPSIRNSARVSDIIANQVFIVQNIRNINEFCRNNELFTPEEIRYVAAVYTNMLKLIDVTMSDLITVIESGKSEMKDDERIKRIDGLYLDIMDKHAFTTAFGLQVKSLASERERERNAIALARKQHNLN